MSYRFNDFSACIGADKNDLSSYGCGYSESVFFSIIGNLAKAGSKPAAKTKSANRSSSSGEKLLAIAEKASSLSNPPNQNITVQLADDLLDDIVTRRRNPARVIGEFVQKYLRPAFRGLPPPSWFAAIELRKPAIDPVPLSLFDINPKHGAHLHIAIYIPADRLAAVERALLRYAQKALDQLASRLSIKPRKYTTAILRARDTGTPVLVQSIYDLERLAGYFAKHFSQYERLYGKAVKSHAKARHQPFSCSHDLSLSA